MTARRILLSIFAFATMLSALAVDFDPLNASIEENLRHPAVPNKAVHGVVSNISTLVRTLRGAGYSVQAVRDGQVAVVTVPAVKLFGAGKTELRADAAEILRPLAPYIRRTDNYKVIIAVHSDDTGDELYNDRLTADRANAIDDYYYTLDGDRETGIIPYGLGFDEPVAANNSIAGRARNRRVEIYFVPTQTLIDKARR